MQRRPSCWPLSISLRQADNVTLSCSLTQLMGLAPVPMILSQGACQDCPQSAVQRGPGGGLTQHPRDMAAVTWCLVLFLAGCAHCALCPASNLQLPPWRRLGQLPLLSVTASFSLHHRGDLGCAAPGPSLLPSLYLSAAAGRALDAPRTPVTVLCCPGQLWKHPRACPSYLWPSKNMSLLI